MQSKAPKKMLNKLAWVTLLALWIATFGWMGDLEHRQRLTQDAVNAWVENQRALKEVTDIQTQNQRLMIALIIGRTKSCNTAG